jgi:hypothetical protein
MTLKHRGALSAMSVSSRPGPKALPSVFFTCLVPCRPSCASLTRRQQREIESEKNQEALPILEEARSILLTAGVPADAIVTATSVLVNREDLARDILKSAHANACGTIVVGHQSFSWIQEVFREHLTDQLIADGDGVSICTVQ